MSNTVQQPAQANGRQTVVSMYHDGQWYSWTPQEPTKKYRGRSQYESMGKILYALYATELFTLLAVGPTGKFAIPSPVPCALLDDEIRAIERPPMPT